MISYDYHYYPNIVYFITVFFLLSVHMKWFEWNLFFVFRIKYVISCLIFHPLTSASAVKLRKSCLQTDIHHIQRQLVLSNCLQTTSWQGLGQLKDTAVTVESTAFSLKTDQDIASHCEAVVVLFFWGYKHSVFYNKCSEGVQAEHFMWKTEWVM